MSDDEKYMREALRIAAYAKGRTSPNPMVGAVIVKNDRIIASGWHHKAGDAHAEINALNFAGDEAKDATLYVTLEPCSHYGKVPPCVDAIIRAGIKRVVFAMIDPNPLVSGKGKEALEKHGIEVVYSVLQEEAQKLNASFIKWITTGMPWVILKSAMTLDGKIATASNQSKWITNERSRQEVHRMRDSVDAILVGIGTVLSDNPHLTTRLNELNTHNPVRIIIDSKARTPLTANVVNDRMAKTIIAVTEAASKDRIALLEEHGAEIVCVNEGEHVNIAQLLKILGKRDIISLLVEGGGTINYSFLSENLVDKVCFFIAPKLFGGRDALTPVEGKGVDFPQEAFELFDTELERFGEDICISGYLRK